jgi:hypothetical protein
MPGVEIKLLQERAKAKPNAGIAFRHRGGLFRATMNLLLPGVFNGQRNKRTIPLGKAEEDDGGGIRP